ncbi:MAG: hypothetical protein ACE5EO_03125 [Candidatus Krumholzibacteriia bacterium]
MTGSPIHTGIRAAGLCVLACLCPHVARPASATRETPNYRIYAEDRAPARDLLGKVSRDRERVHRRIVEFLARPGPSPKIDYHIYPSFESKGLHTGNTQLAHADIESNAIHLVINDWIRGDDPKMDAVLLLKRHLGEPATHLLETGLAVYFSETWRGRGYRYWAGRLSLSDNLPALVDLVDNDALGRESYLVAEAAAASFVDYVIERFGGAVLIEHYRDWRPGPEEVARLEAGWKSHLQTQSRDIEKQVRHERENRRRPDSFQKGFCHAHEGYQIFNGYLSKKSDEALEKLAEMGTNAVSITPFTYMRNPKRPVPLRFSNGAGSENDESVIHSAHTARQLGMTVMLKPHVWLGGGSWPGDVEMQNADEWRSFFEYYYRWMRHYALLAEMYDIDLLCIGVELAQTTTAREEEWRQLIKRLRGIFSGPMVYAANWGEEFENVAFWDDLDYIGIDCYYPLASRDDASPKDLRDGAERMLERVGHVYDRFRKPVLITEIGFTSTRAPWKKPHQPAWRQTAFPEHQALCYEAVFAALQGKAWCEGIYWWKWPSFLEHGGRGSAGFTPNNKPAEKVVRKWYGRSWQR